MSRLPTSADIALRLAAVVAWLCALVWLGVLAFGYGYAAYDHATYRDIRAEGPWLQVIGLVDSVRIEHRRAMGFDKEREFIGYSYEFGSLRHSGRTETFRLSAGSGGSDGPSTEYRKGGPIVVWVSQSRPERSELAEPRAPRSPWPSAGGFLACLSALVLMTWLAKRIVFRSLSDSTEFPLPGERPDAGRPVAKGIRVEFPRAGAITDRSGSLLLGIVGFAIMIMASRSDSPLIAFLFGLGLVWTCLRAMRPVFRRCVVEAGAAGLDCRCGYPGFSSRTFIPRLEIECLEVSPDGSAGPGADMKFEIAALRRDGNGRFVLGGNVTGVAAADAMVRRIGQALSLSPEQVHGANASFRRQLGAAERAREGLPFAGRRP